MFRDVSEVCLVLVVFSAMAYTGWTGGHIAVDLIAEAVSKRTLQVIDVLMRGAGAALLAVICWHSVHRAIEAHREGEATNLISLPLYPFFWVIAIGFGLFAVVLFVLTIRAARGNTEFPKQ